MSDKLSINNLLNNSVKNFNDDDGDITMHTVDDKLLKGHSEILCQASALFKNCIIINYLWIICPTFL